MRQNLATLACLATTVFAASVPRASAPTVTLDQATVTGVSAGAANNFLGIPFALPPVDDLRFQLPQPNAPYLGEVDATQFGAACFQQATNAAFLSALPPATVDAFAEVFTNITTPIGEDCLTVNVVAPANATPESKLPVVFWIFGGGFTIGATSIYNGTNIVTQSIEQSQPVVYVSVSYRLNAFGFLGGQEVKDAGVGNLGLQDQRLALKWVQKYITQFGGDPTKVTIWGESAGSISVVYQMITSGGNPEGLFRAGFMESGSAAPLADITKGQADFDFLVQQTNCTGAADKLQCLREAPAQTILNVVNETPSLLGSPTGPANLTGFGPSIDGVFLTEDPQISVATGRIAEIPFVNGDCDDEGTLFTAPLIGTNITFAEFVASEFGGNATLVAAFEALYPDDPAAGSPFGTGDANEFFPEFKRIAALLGDTDFQAPRRNFFKNLAPRQPAFSYITRRNKDIPFFGTFHASDIANFYNSGELGSVLIQFVNHLTPNGSPNISIPFPQYDVANPLVFTLNDPPAAPLTIMPDTFRVAATNLITALEIAGAGS